MVLRRTWRGSSTGSTASHRSRVLREVPGDGGGADVPAVARPVPAFGAWPVNLATKAVCVGGLSVMRRGASCPRAYGGSRRHTCVRGRRAPVCGGSWRRMGQGASCRCTCTDFVDVRFPRSRVYGAPRKSTLRRISRRQRLARFLAGRAVRDFTRSDTYGISGPMDVSWVPRRSTRAEFLGINRARDSHDHAVQDSPADRMGGRSPSDETVSGRPPVPAVPDRLDRRMTAVSVRVRRGRGVSRRTCA